MRVTAYPAPAAPPGQLGLLPLLPLVLGPGLIAAGLWLKREQYRAQADAEIAQAARAGAQEPPATLSPEGVRQWRQTQEALQSAANGEADLVWLAVGLAAVSLMLILRR